MASHAPHFMFETILRASFSVDVLIRLARVLDRHSLGLTGRRPALRLVAFKLLQHVLHTTPHNIDALCLKGEMLLPWKHYGRAHIETPVQVLEEALHAFDKASNTPLGLFLKGRLLLTMEPIHKDSQKAKLGRQCVLDAANANCARALVYLAHRYEYPQLDSIAKFASDVPKDRLARERYIVSLYKIAAEAGDADALNDLGTSHAQAYGGLKPDFDQAAHFYSLAIKAGSLHAFENLGSHYETGMNMCCPDRIDLKKAVYFYRLGARKGCPKCAYNLAAGYEEGMDNVLQRDLKHAEKYYWLALALGNDLNDVQSIARTIKDLLAFYITRIKLGGRDDVETVAYEKKLRNALPTDADRDMLMAKANKCVRTLVRSGDKEPLEEMLGEDNANSIAERVKQVLKTGNGYSAAKKDALIMNLTGNTLVGTNVSFREKRSRKGSAMTAKANYTGRRRKSGAT